MIVLCVFVFFNARFTFRRFARRVKTVTIEHIPYIITFSALVLFVLPVYILENSFAITHTPCEPVTEAEIITYVVETSGPLPEPTTTQKYTEVVATLTAYCPCKRCCGKTDGITASGTKATAGRTVAVDNSIIPYGTEIIIDGHSYIAEDCGAAVKGYTIDIFFDTHEEALSFGKQTKTVYVAETV